MASAPGNFTSAGANRYASLTTSFTGANNDLTFTAKAKSASGNSITVAVAAGGPLDRALSVAVAGNAITVSPATDEAGAVTSTATAVRDAVNANGPASALVTAALAAGNDGSGVVGTLAATALAGGESRRTARSTGRTTVRRDRSGRGSLSVR